MLFLASISFVTIFFLNFNYYYNYTFSDRIKCATKSYFNERIKKLDNTIADKEPFLQNGLI